MAISSTLQFVGTVPSGFRYREILSGSEFDSPSIIDGAKGNPPVDDSNPTIQGSTTLQQIGADKSGLYGGLTDEKSRVYTVNQEVTGTGENQKVADEGTKVDAGDAVRSKFNRWSLFKTENISGKSGVGKSSNKKEMSKSLYGPASANGNVNPALEPTARNIVEFAKSTNEVSLGFDYDLADFIQCQHYGQISNNYLVTLRRFPYPAHDDIISPKIFDSTGKPVDAHQPDIARAITWLSPALGNDLKEILKFKVGFKWKDIESGIQEVQASSGSRGALGASIDGSPLLSAIEAGLSGRSAAQTATIRDKGAGYDPAKETYPNKVFGPYNVIKNVLAREQGLVFEQDFTLTFYYDIRGYGNTSPKAAFMDTMSNLLVLTYNSAPFWGGATRFLGNGQVGKPFGDFKKLASGDYSGFFGSLKDQFMGMGQGFADAGSAIKNAFTGGGLNALGDSKILDNIIGGGLMKLFNSPQGASTIASFITGDPTGNWHLTIGNPLAPMITVGNLALQDAQFEFEGPLGYEDFPTKLKVTITLKPGRPRDKGDIESMFNAGRGRMYLQPDSGAQMPDGTIVDSYGKTVTDSNGKASKKIPGAMYRRISDINAG